MLTIGLTGGIASGKTYAGKVLADLGATVIDADRIAHQAYAPGTPGFDALVAAFGPGIVAADGAIDRAELARRVFEDPGDLARLTTIVWPLTRGLVEAERDRHAAGGVEVFVVEAALLYEAGWHNLFDEVWLVRSPRDAVMQRLAGRSLSPEEAQRRFDAATDVEAAARRAGRVIENDTTLEALEARVADALKDAQRVA